MTLEEGLFGAEHVPIRRGAASYLSRLHGLAITDDVRGDSWIFWALAEPETLWRVPGPIPEYEYMWLLHPSDPGTLHKALVQLDTGRIVRRRPYAPAKPGPKRTRLQRVYGITERDRSVDVSRGRWRNPILHADVAGQYPSLDERGVAQLVLRDFTVLARRGELHFPNWRHLGGQRGPVTFTYPPLATIRAELAGRDLACTCLATEPCHGDVLLDVANGRDDEQHDMTAAAAQPRKDK